MYVTFHIYDIHKNMKPMCTKYSVLYMPWRRYARSKKCWVVLRPKDWIRTFNKGHWLSFSSNMKFNTLTKYSISEDCRFKIHDIFGICFSIKINCS